MSDIERRLEEINQSLYAAKRYYDVWWVLNGKETRPKYIGVMNQYVDFSGVMMGATFDASITALYKVIEKNNRTHNIHGLIRVLGTSNKFTKEDLKSYRDRLAIHQKTIKGICIIRNNVIGHRAIKLEHKEVFKKAGIKFNQWVALMDELISIMCDIYRKNNNIHHEAFFTSYAAEELEDILQILMAE